MGLCTSSYQTDLIKCHAPPKRTFKNISQMVKLISVYDGDTIKIATKLTKNEELREYSLRVYGIDTPELRTKNVLEKRAAQAAKSTAIKLLQPSPLVWVEFMQEDKYGRLMGKVFSTRKTSNGCRQSTYVKNRSLADQLIEMKQAKAYFGKAKTQWTNQDFQLCVSNAL